MSRIPKHSMVRVIRDSRIGTDNFLIREGTIGDVVLSYSQSLFGKFYVEVKLVDGSTVMMCEFDLEIVE
jgi:hypothetical protein